MSAPTVEEAIVKASRDLDLIRRSIDHWLLMAPYRCYEDFVGGPWAEDCPLCQKYGPSCIECPIAIATGETSCYGTSYRAARAAYEKLADKENSSPDPESIVTWQNAAREMIRYLLDLHEKHVQIKEYLIRSYY